MHKILANTIFLGKDILCLPECHSTNDSAMQRYKQGLAREGSIIITDKQTKGRGQRGNQWYSEPGKNLTFTLVLSPLFLDASEQFELNIIVTLAIQEVLSQYVPGIKIKWPNDIVHEDGEKLGGILIENIVSQKGIEIALVGIGLNINQVEFAFPGPTSLARLSGGIYDKEEVFKLIVKSIETHYMRLKRGERRVLRQSFLQHLFRFNLWASYDDGENFEGKIIGITEEGKLILEKEHQVRNQYGFKEVKFL
jgi:BirA family transcriptional regulator, biotin operon repressor / biotin---[acetyl-CoA-carboxylase] ligase